LCDVDRIAVTDYIYQENVILLSSAFT